MPFGARQRAPGADGAAAHRLGTHAELDLYTRLLSRDSNATVAAAAKRRSGLKDCAPAFRDADVALMCATPVCQGRAGVLAGSTALGSRAFSVKCLRSFVDPWRSCCFRRGLCWANT